MPRAKKCFDAELIAILIGSSRNESAVDLSKRILASVDNNLNALEKYHCHNSFNLKE
jgi:DNA repair protein RadC